MPSALVSRFRNDTAPRLMRSLGDNGGVAAVLRIVVDDPDPLEPPTVTDTAQPIPAFVKGVTADMVASDPNLVITDLQVLVAAVDYVPLANKMIEVDGAQRRILRVNPIPAAGDPAIYKFFVR